MIYLDNAAAVPVEAESLAFMSKNASLVTGNQEGIHCAARKTGGLLQKAATDIISIIAGQADNVNLLWGDCGSALLSHALSLPYFRKGNIITTDLEHPALTAAINRSGAEVRIVSTPQGKTDLKHLDSLIDEQTKLVAIHHIQSETGIIQDLAAVKQVIKSQKSTALLLADTVQSAGKIKIPWEKSELDFCFISGHKFGTPGGAAMLYRNRTLPDGTKVSKFFESLRNRHYLACRPEPLIMLTMADCLKRCYAKSENYLRSMAKLNMLMRRELENIKLPHNRKIIFTVPYENASPYIVHILIPEFQGAVLVRMLSEHDIAVSSGTACAAETDKPGETMYAMGYRKTDGYSILRISLWHNTSPDMLKTFTKTLEQVLSDY